MKKMNRVVSLAKNETVSLSKMTNGLSTVMFGLGWGAAKKKRGFLSSLFSSLSADSLDLDASCILLDAQGEKVDSIWFRQLSSECGNIAHSGDNKTGDGGGGDDETIFANLSRLPSNVEYLVLTVNSFAGQTFNEVGNAFCRVVDTVNKKELTRFTLSEQGGHTGIVAASLKRNNGAWDFTAHGVPTSGRTVSDLVPIARTLLS